MPNSGSATLDSRPRSSKNRPIDHAAVVLAAGEGSRSRPLARNPPKPMRSAATKPIHGHVFDQLVDVGISEIVVGYRRDRVQSYFGSSYRGTALTDVTQEEQLGTGRAVLETEPAADGTCLVGNGDRIADSRIGRDVLEAHDSDTAAAVGSNAEIRAGATVRGTVAEGTEVRS
ncbi:sugar phosphate nucleotidyltransferase [Haloterrigena salinisoli]|uniref:sugar phosphate nucleotidyltransferase n=1 Tax=Haloterrigena salinisoli TaxID=3132747 RepID=UPI0030CA67A8